MLVGCWAPKGGVGTSTLTAVLARVASDHGPVVVVDPSGDVGAILGVPASEVGWRDLLAVSELHPDAIDRVAVRAGGGLRVVGPGRGSLGAATTPTAAVASALRAGASCTFLDLGAVAPGDATATMPSSVQGDRGTDALGAAPDALIARLDTLVAVLRPCYLAVRRAAGHPLLGASRSVVLFEEPRRTLSRRDVAVSIARRSTSIPVTPAIARAIDSGTLGVRVPEALARPARSLLDQVGVVPSAPEAVGRARLSIGRVAA